MVAQTGGSQLKAFGKSLICRRRTWRKIEEPQPISVPIIFRRGRQPRTKRRCEEVVERWSLLHPSVALVKG
ncbi:hypothetical protein J6590_004324 [Homalodisca vitripennis]|nr:hypothetical protein J6590_004324 [Homalodisca vitripennis]